MYNILSTIHWSDSSKISFFGPSHSKEFAFLTVGILENNRAPALQEK